MAVPPIRFWIDANRATPPRLPALAPEIVQKLFALGPWRLLLPPPPSSMAAMVPPVWNENVSVEAPPVRFWKALNVPTFNEPLFVPVMLQELAVSAPISVLVEPGPATKLWILLMPPT